MEGGAVIGGSWQLTNDLDAIRGDIVGVNGVVRNKIEVGIEIETAEDVDSVGAVVNGSETGTGRQKSG